MDYTATETELAEVKNALRLDYTLDDDMLSQLIVNAKTYIHQAVGDIDGLEERPQFKFAVVSLCVFWYQNNGEDIKETPYQVRSMIHQLRSC